MLNVCGCPKLGDLKYDPPGTYISRAGLKSLNVRFRRAVRWDWNVCDISEATTMDNFIDNDGKPVFSPPGAFHADHCLQGPLDDFVTNTNWFSSKYGINYGQMETIGILGAQRDRAPCTPANSLHCMGKALDIAWITWNGGVHSRPCNGPDEANDLTSLRRLVAIEAGLRKRFGFVLNRYIGNIDPEKGSVTEGAKSPHRNHFHIEVGCGLGLRVDRTRLDDPVLSANRHKRSSHCFLQDCIRAFTDVQPDYDAYWGRQAELGYRTLLSDLGMELLDPIGTLSHFQLFLSYVMMHGFANRRAGAYRWGGTVSLAGV